MTTIGKPVVFRPNTKDNLTINNKAINIILVLLATFLLIFVLYRLFTKENVTIHFGYFLTLPGLLNILIIILIYACNALNNSFNGLNMNEQQMLNDANKTVRQWFFYNKILIFSRHLTRWQENMKLCSLSSQFLLDSLSSVLLFF